MTPADLARITAFVEKWQGSEGNEQANSQTFFGDLCMALGVAGPPPKGSVAGDPYCFEKSIKAYEKRGESTKRADFYKQDCFLIEAKQGSNTSNKGHGKRGTKAYTDAMQGAFNQARQYVQLLELPTKPPFLITCDIGSHFEIWEGFSGEYGSYGARQRLNLADLKQRSVCDRFVKIFTDPQALNPEKERARVTREVAAELAKLSRWLEEQGHGAEETANFLMRCIFTMFAEDVELLKGEVFTKALRDRWIPHPETFTSEIGQLWQTMNTGGNFGFERVLQFNGSFFDQAIGIPLPKAQLEVLYAAAAKDWSQVEPAIFGTLLERALEKKERSRLGAHYTPRSYVERLVRPVVMEPLRQGWDEIEFEIKRLLEPEVGQENPKPSQLKQAEQEIRTFLDQLRTIKILDPACGTGNFLYVSLDLLKGLEQEVITRLVDVAGQVQLNVLEQINPSQFLGIELNPRAAAIAELVIWIGYLQWYFKRYGNAEPPEPVLQAFGNIENRDAVLAYDGREPDVDPKTGQVRTRWGGRMMVHPVTGEEVPDPEDQVVIYRYLNPRPAEWPEADYVVSNPPFIGNFKMREALGDGYAETIRQTYSEVPETVDYVMYWWHKAAYLTRQEDIFGFGFITTNSIRQKWQRRVIDFHLQQKKPIRLLFAVPDHPWDDQGADVRISMTAATSSNSTVYASGARILAVISEEDADNPEEAAEKIQLENKLVDQIFSDLRSGIDLSKSLQLKSNDMLAGAGVKLHGSGFIIDESDLNSWQGQYLGHVVKKYRNGRDLFARPRNLFVIDFFDLSEKEASRYQEPYKRVLEKVKPERDVNKRKVRRDNWWLFGENMPKTRSSINGLSRYIATPETAKHRVFLFLDEEILPDNKLIVFGFEDAYFLGVLSSRLHVYWSVEAGSWLGVGNDSVYVKTRCFDPFPFPDPTPEQKQKIRDLGDRLDAHRKQVQATHPDITITGMYNLLEKLRAGEPFTDKDRAYNNRALVSTLKQIHDELDTAVLDAYGWGDLVGLPTPGPSQEGKAQNPLSGGVSAGRGGSFDDIILERLVALNAERAEEERNGLIRWLRPEYQAPNESPLSRSGRGAGGEGQQTTLEGVVAKAEPIVEPVEQQKWPTQPKEQLAAIRDLLRTTSGDWTTKQIAAQFKGRTTQKKLDAIIENLERLEWFGLVLSQVENGMTSWQFTESIAKDVA